MRLIERIKNHNGASMVLALIFFLVCALAGSAILSIARSYEKRTVTDFEKEGEYLAALSAAEFLKAQLDGCQGTWNIDESGIDPEAETENRVREQLLELLDEICREYQKYRTGRKKEIDLKLALENEADEGWTIPEIEVHIIMESDDEEENPENLPEELEEFMLPVSIKAEFFLAGENKKIMSLTAIGVVDYYEGDMLEVYWEEIKLGRY